MTLRRRRQRLGAPAQRRRAGGAGRRSRGDGCRGRRRTAAAAARAAAATPLAPRPRRGRPACGSGRRHPCRSSDARSTPCSAASLRTSGVTYVSSPPLGAAAPRAPGRSCRSGRGAAARGAGAGAACGGAGAPGGCAAPRGRWRRGSGAAARGLPRGAPAAPMTPSVAPTGTVLVLRRVDGEQDAGWPATGSRCRPCPSRSRAAARPAATVSPTCFSQRVTVPSVTLSPSAGSVTGVPPDARSPTVPGRAGAAAGAAAAGSGAGAACRLGAARGSGSGCATCLPGPLPRRRRAPPAAGCRRGGAAAGAGLVPDHGELGADRDRLVLLRDDADQDAGRGRRDLGVDLVGGHLEQRLVGLDARHPRA